MSFQQDERDIQLEFRDRLRYNDILELKLKSLASKISNPRKDMRVIQSMLLDLLTDIPDSWKDDEFEEEMKHVMKKRKVDVRPTFGNAKISMNVCIENKIPIFREIREINYFRLKNAIINLFDRRQMLIRKEKIEYTTGLNLKFGSIDDYIEKELGEEFEEEE